MPVSNAITPWTLTVPAGSLQQWNTVFTVPSTGAPYNISGATGWEYVVRATATDTGTPLIDITTTPNSQGMLNVTATASLSQVQVALNPAATVNLAPGAYFHALWMSPGTATAYCWLSGEFIVQGTAQP